MTAVVELREAALSDKPVVRRLVELYLHDFSEFDGRDVDQHGMFGYRYLDHYWTEPSRHPFLLVVEGQVAGFAFVRSDDDEGNRVAEFFVSRKYRRRSVGQQAARMLFARFPGPWKVEQVRGNPQARAFWRSAIPFEFEEAETDDGWVQSFESQEMLG